jgi:cytochrome c553
MRTCLSLARWRLPAAKNRPRSGLSLFGLNLATLLLGLGTNLALADGSVETGMAKAVVCAACHGPNGNSSNPEWPSLAGQHASYIAEQLTLFKTGKRHNAVMMPMVSTLSDQDIADIAAYYAAQVPAGLEADPSYWEAGQKLYRSGNTKKLVPACIACHGPVGRGNAPARYPALRAQHSVYVQKQLQDYASGARTNPQSPFMNTIAQRMSAEDMRNVASYVQGIR